MFPEWHAFQDGGCRCKKAQLGPKTQSNILLGLMMQHSIDKYPLMHVSRYRSLGFLTDRRRQVFSYGTISQHRRYDLMRTVNLDYILDNRIVGCVNEPTKRTMWWTPLVMSHLTMRDPKLPHPPVILTFPYIRDASRLLVTIFPMCFDRGMARKADTTHSIESVRYAWQ